MKGSELSAMMVRKRTQPAAWPPILRHRGPSYISDTRISGPSRTTLYLIITLVVGIALLFGVSAVEGVFVVADPLRDLGIAAIIASILGLIVDRLLKRELARDAIQVALGYMLPMELKEEMHWIYKMPFLGTNHVQTYDLTVNEDGETVTSKVRICRRLVNLTDEPQEITLGFWTDDWGYENKPSQINRAAYRLEGERWKKLDVENAVREPDRLMVQREEKMTVPKGRYAEFEYIFQETKRVNDSHHMVFHTHPTKNPQVIVSAGEQLEHRVRFGHRQQAELVDNPEGGSYHLEGTLLPEQGLEVRWWKKATAPVEGAGEEQS